MKLKNFKTNVQSCFGLCSANHDDAHCFVLRVNPNVRSFCEQEIKNQKHISKKLAEFYKQFYKQKCNKKGEYSPTRMYTTFEHFIIIVTI